MPGKVEAIYLFPERGGAPQAREQARAVAGHGLEGDRYFEEGLDPARQLTLVDAAVLEEVAETDPTLALGPGESRRQLTTSGVDLNSLVSVEFTVGEARCRGIELCEPCSHLEQLTGRAGIMRALVHRGGLNAEIIDGGVIAVGDPVAPATP
jgi:MOSC domain-containing protein YiiM